MIVTLKLNSIVIYEPTGEELVISKSQKAAVGSEIETANDSRYIVTAISKESKVFVRSKTNGS